MSRRLWYYIESAGFDYLSIRKKINQHEIEQYMVDRRASAEVMIDYAKYIAKGRVPLFEAALVRRKDPKDLYYYARDVAKTRIKRFEQALLGIEHADIWMVKYAADVAKVRIPAFEEKLAESDASIDTIMYYMDVVAKTRIPAFEPKIAKRSNQGKAMYEYARLVGSIRIPEFEKRFLEIVPVIWLYYYLENVVRGRDPALEAKLLEHDVSGDLVCMYAVRVAKCRIHEAEIRLVKLPRATAHARTYQREFDCRIPEFERNGIGSFIKL